MHSDALLEQEELWIDGQREEHAITQMSDEHLANLKGWLLRNAPGLLFKRIADAYGFASHLNGEMAQDAMDSEISELEEKNPYLWMEERPLFIAIGREISKRQGFSVCRIIERD